MMGLLIYKYEPPWQEVSVKSLIRWWPLRPVGLCLKWKEIQLGWESFCVPQHIFRPLSQEIHLACPQRSIKCISKMNLIKSEKFDCVYLNLLWKPSLSLLLLLLFTIIIFNEETLVLSDTDLIYRNNNEFYPICISVFLDLTPNYV